MIKLMIFDVDGTLYDLNNHEIPNSCVEAIRQAKANGVLFAIATGRPHYGLGKAIMQLNPDYILAVNGAMLIDQHQTILSQHHLTQEDVAEIIEFCRCHQAGLCWKFADRYVIAQHPNKIDWLEGQMNSDIDRHVFTFCLQLDNHFPTQPLSASVHVQAQFVRQFADHPRLSFLRYSETGYDVVLKQINKGVGVQELRESLHLKKDELVAFGDNFNDIEMMQQVGTKIAMGNAVDELKDIADFVTTSTNQDGIAHGLHYLGLIK